MELTNRLTKTLLGVGLALALGFALPAGNPALAQGSWETSTLGDVATMAVSAGDLTGATTGGKLYIVGSEGTTASTPNFVFIYDPVLDSWSTNLTSMPNVEGDGRRQSAMRGAAIAGKVYVVGGAINTDSNRPTGVSFVYDPGTDSWTQIATMPTARLAPAVAAIDGKLYAVGGWSRCGLTCFTHNNLEVYDPGSGPPGTWTTKTPMPTSRQGPGAGVIDGKLYVVGGLFRNPLNRPWDAHVIGTLEIYDPVAGTWDTSKAPMHTPRQDAAVAVIGGRLHVVGGHRFVVVPSGSTGIVTTNEYVDTHEVYDPATDTWQTLPPMPTARATGGAGVIDDRLYVAGGLGSSGTQDILEVFSLGINDIDIDIKPGSDPNSINLESAGIIPVAILGSDTFDATAVDGSTCTLGDAHVKVVGKSDKLLCSVEDVNDDGFLDQVCKFVTINLGAELGDTTATIFCSAPEEIEGTDSIRLVPPE